MLTKLPSIQPNTAKVVISNEKKGPLRLFKGRSISEVEDPIVALKKNLFAKLEKYDKDENTQLNKSYGLIENSNLQTNQRVKYNKSLNASFNEESTEDIRSSKQSKVNQCNLLEDDDITDEQFFSDLYNNNNPNQAKFTVQKDILVSTNTQIKKFQHQPRVRNQNTSFSGIEKTIKNKDELNLSFQNTKQENIDEVYIKQRASNKAPFITNILDQIDQNSNLIRSKHKMTNNFNAVTPSKIISDSSKTLNMNFQVNNNIQNMQILNSFSDKKGSEKSVLSHNNQNQTNNFKNTIEDINKKPKDKKQLLFYTPFQNEIIKKEKQKVSIKPEVQQMNIKKVIKENKDQSQKELPEYNENYTGIESFDDYSDNDSENNEEFEKNNQILEEYQEMYGQSGNEEDNQQIFNMIGNMKKDCSDLDQDLFSLKEMLTDMRGNWKEYEDLGADFGDIDSFIKEVNIFEKEKNLSNLNSSNKN